MYLTQGQRGSPPVTAANLQAGMEDVDIGEVTLLVETRRERISLYMVGVVASAGALAGGAVGYWVATLVFTPSERAGQSLVMWILENGLGFIALLLPLLVGSSAFGWIALPAAVGAALHWKEVRLGAKYQMLFGVGSAALGIGVLGVVPGIREDISIGLTWAFVILTVFGAPTLSRYVVRGR